MPIFTIECVLPASADEAFAWHARPGALERLTPPWERVQVLSHRGLGIMDGARVELAVRFGPFTRRWLALHENYVVGRQFGDRQLSGPFHKWVHLRRFIPIDDHSCRHVEEIEYQLPTGRLAQRLLGGWVERRLARAFTYRHETLARDLRRHGDFPEPSRLRVAVTGATGLIGGRLCDFLSTGGHEVLRIVRRPSGRADEVLWEPARGSIDADRLEGVDAVVHLAGENIAAGRWTPERKRRLRDSRVEVTRLLCETLAGLRRPPRALIAASAIGYYGDRGEDWVDEESPPGEGFLPEMCVAWEAAAEPARRAGLRVAQLRIGVVLSGAGGALAALRPLFRLGLGGRLGSGRQYFSWIEIDDLLGAIHFLLARDDLAGAFNATAPEAVSNADFTRALARALRRPVGPPAPGVLLRLALGELGAELLRGARVRPARLTAAGFRFDYPALAPALRRQLGAAEQ